MPLLLLFLVTFSANLSAGDTVHIDSHRAQSNYMLNCQGCHQADGSGLPGSVPTMRGFVAEFLAVPGGREFLVQVPGSANSPLSDAELAELLNWILLTMSRAELGDNFDYYTTGEVSRAREVVLGDVAKTRAELVAKMNPGG
jgi:mono/diheme cytochrome c family protein